MVLRGKSRRGLVPLTVLALLLLGYDKSALATFSRQLVGASPLLIVPLVLGAVAAGLWWLDRRPGVVDRLNTFFTLTGFLMVGWLGLRFVADLRHAHLVVERSRLARELAQPIPAPDRSAGSPAGVQRDVYLIVLDEYANSGVLKDEFGFDNRFFEDSLRH